MTGQERSLHSQRAASRVRLNGGACGQPMAQDGGIRAVSGVITAAGLPHLLRWRWAGSVDRRLDDKVDDTSIAKVHVWCSMVRYGAGWCRWSKTFAELAPRRRR